jgi:hypothetical protein
MKQFFALYMAPREGFEKVMAEMSSMTPEKQQEMNKEWEEWAASTKGAIVDMGKPLGKTKRVTESAVSDTRNEIGGYTIVQAESQDEACKIMQTNPHFKMIPGSWIEVMEMMEM